MLFWQHGDYIIHPNGSLTLSPIDVDSRQLMSEPCESDESTYARVSQWELYEVCPPSRSSEQLLIEEPALRNLHRPLP